MNNLDVKHAILSRLTWRVDKFATYCTNSYHHCQLQKASIFSARDIHTHMTVRELNTLYDLATGLGKSAKALEIGSYIGASSCYLAAALSIQGGHLFCVDTWENQTMPEGERNTYNEFVNNTSGVSNYITPIKKNSKDLIDSDVSVPINLVFIDGDHSYLGVKNDYEKVYSWIIGGGILAFHDCMYFQGVSKIIGYALASGNWQFGGHIDNLLWLRKIEKGILEFPHRCGN